LASFEGISKALVSSPDVSHVTATSSWRSAAGDRSRSSRWSAAGGVALCQRAAQVAAAWLPVPTREKVMLRQRQTEQQPGRVDRRVQKRDSGTADWRRAGKWSDGPPQYSHGQGVLVRSSHVQRLLNSLNIRPLICSTNDIFFFIAG